MKYFYDRKSDSLYLTLAERPYGDSVEAAPGVVLDFDKAGRLVGIDLEHASKTVDVADLQMHEEPVGVESESAKLDGASLKREREALGLSQTELARKLSVSSNTIARWERGELRIEHPLMVQLAMAALRDKKPHHDVSLARPLAPNTLSAHDTKRDSRSNSGQLTSVRRHKPQRSSDVGRAKKK
jgi:DNA-binding transcriptional regulator YiaG